jgi:hypothetical protein
MDEVTQEELWEMLKRREAAKHYHESEVEANTQTSPTGKGVAMPFQH